MAMSKNAKTDHQQVDTLQNKLKEMVPSMVIFSDSLRSLFAINQVTSSSPATRAFLEVRDNARKNGIVYSKMVLPMTEEVIRAIGFFSDYFTDLDFNDWSESLEDIISDVEKAQGVCDILKQMHNNIIIELKKNETKAELSITQIEKMAEQFRDEERSLQRKATELNESADEKRDWGWTGIFTLGISTAILNSCAADDDAAARESLASAVAKRENAVIASNAVIQTKCRLIPAMKAFINGLEVCTLFLSDTRERLAKMKNAGDKGARKPYYLMMKNRAKELNGNCLQFLALTDMMRNNLAAIPTESHDKNYVDTWFDEQKKQFQREHKTVWDRIKGEVAKIATNGPMKMINK